MTSCFLQVIASGIILLDYVWISLYHTHYWVLFVNDGSYDGSFIGPYSLSLDRHASFYQVSGSLNKDCFLGCFSEFFPTLFLLSFLCLSSCGVAVCHSQFWLENGQLNEKDQDLTL